MLLTQLGCGTAAKPVAEEQYVFRQPDLFGFVHFSSFWFLSSCVFNQTGNFKLKALFCCDRQEVISRNKS